MAVARRELLLAVHRHRLPREDLEDCYSQATLELLARARSGPQLHGVRHVANALEQKFVSRVRDRRRAIRGRSPIESALSVAASLSEPDGVAPDPADRRASVPELVARRMDLGRVREVAAELTADQRLLIACQVGLGMDCEAFCRRYGWTPAKFRKVAQRARRRLTRLLHEYGSGERCRRLEPDLIAHVARVATPGQSARVTAHLANCSGCRRTVRELCLAERRVAALIPLATTAGGAGIGGAAGGAVAGAGAGGGGALLLGGAGAAKACLAALCLAGLTGGGLLLGSGPGPANHAARGGLGGTRAAHALALRRPRRAAAVGTAPAPATPDARRAATAARRTDPPAREFDAAGLSAPPTASGTARRRHARRPRRAIASGVVPPGPAVGPPGGGHERAPAPVTIGFERR